MKNYALAICVVFLFSCQQQKTASTEDVKETLKSIVEGETFAYMEKDYKKWASYWDRGSEVLRLDVTKSGFSQTRGWDKNGVHLESFFEENPEPITSTFENSNYLILHDTNLAWVAFDQTWTSPSGDKTVAKATITLVKKETDWKIISYTAIQYDADDKQADTLERE